ncbi:MAG: outer membrane protein assembly factor BamD [Ignavibacteriales bacterium]|nr:outer membrane protein assembly factor BamD [Ignavibacteriales bacterium]
MLNRLLEKHLNSFFILFSCITLSTFIAGCGSDQATKQLSAEERYALGMKAFKGEDYLAAIEEFKVVSLQYQGSKVADSAQFSMAECRFLREEYILAAFEYDVLIRTMPSSIFVSRARFRRATCFYNLSPKFILDQNYSRKAIDEYQAFLEYHPTDTLVSLAEQRINELNTKLAQKDFENGITYMHMEYYKAATYYFDLVLDKYHDTQYAEPATLKKAEALTSRKKYADAKEALQKFREKYPSSVLKSDADRLDSDIEAGLRAEKTKNQKALESMKDTSKPVPQPGK